jgi:hypothetical protein
MTTAHAALRPTRLLIAVGLFLMVPFLAMQFTQEVNWSVMDFVTAGALLLGTGLTYQLLASKSGTLHYRAAAALAVLGTLGLIWVNLAVGAIGEPSSPANLMYLGVIATGVTGTALARFQAKGMARTLFAMAGAVALVVVIALAIGALQLAGNVPEILGNAFFVASFAASALLFQRAARG